MKKIKIKYHDEITHIESMKLGDWIDLRNAEDIDLREGEFTLISLGISMKLPDGYEALVIPRSSLFKSTGIIQANGVGLIDNSYCGDNDIWMFPAYATRDIYIPKDCRICQFRIQLKMPQVEFEVVEELNESNRGGFGSTGVK